MRKNYDFTKARRGPIAQQPGKTRVSIYLDDDLVKRLRERADAAGRGYQAMINESVREYLVRLERRPLARRVEVTADEVRIALADGRLLSVPLGWFPRLLSARPEARTRSELLGDGEAIHWPDADEDIDVAGLLAGAPSAELLSHVTRPKHSP